MHRVADHPAMRVANHRPMRIDGLTADLRTFQECFSAQFVAGLWCHRADRRHRRSRGAHCLLLFDAPPLKNETFPFLTSTRATAPPLPCCCPSSPFLGAVC